MLRADDDHAGTEADAVKYDIQNGSGASSGAIFLFPRGVKQNGVVGWDDSCGGADIPFDKNMLSTIENEYCIDTSRVFAAGFSWGCDHVTAMHCCLGDQVRAISGASCTDEFSKPTDHTTYDNKCVANSRPTGARTRGTSSTPSSDRLAVDVIATERLPDRGDALEAR